MQFYGFLCVRFHDTLGGYQNNIDTGKEGEMGESRFDSSSPRFILVPRQSHLIEITNVSFRFSRHTKQTYRGMDWV